MVSKVSWILFRFQIRQGLDPASRRFNYNNTTHILLLLLLLMIIIMKILILIPIICVKNESACTVSFHNFKSQKFKLSVSNPKSKYVAYLSVLSQISNCQGLGRKHKHELLKTDRTLAHRRTQHVRRHVW